MRRGGVPDVRTMAEAFSYAGIDPRVWFSFGTVDDEDPVAFDDDFGPIVGVTLQPSREQCVCRVAGFIAGKGEGQYMPFAAGDEVAVALPGGTSRAGGLIVGRMNNAIDAFPMDSVAGRDPKRNDFAFARHRTPYVHEAAGSYLVREAVSGAFVSLADGGTITLRDGQRAALQLSPDALTYQSGDGAHLLQLDVTAGRLTIKTGDAILTLSSSSASPEVNSIAVPGALSLSALGAPAIEHVATVESVVNLIVNVLAQIAIQIPGPVVGAALGALVPTVTTAALAAAATAPQLPPVALAIVAALTAQGALGKPPGVPAQGQMKPGVGCAGLLAG